jgi:hypothetical protein
LGLARRETISGVSLLDVAAMVTDMFSSDPKAPKEARKSCVLYNLESINIALSNNPSIDDYQVRAWLPRVLAT